VFVGLHSFDLSADHVGPIMSKDIDLFAHEARGTEADPAVLLGAADRFLELLHHPRPDGSDPTGTDR
jgi:hypothetical protein